MTRSGRCLGVLQWIKLDLGGGVTYENHPGRERSGSHWHQVIYPFPQPIELEAGQRVILDAEHNRANVHIAIDKVTSGRDSGLEKGIIRAA